ncbi:Imm1 family immunity protein [Amycolatopsis sp. NPDC001319]|uniref:Imm1 family immunity protein n=1 Tax=unclassified Amycolatopsis TaxID=2618356 RepID=UPI003691E7D3
MVELEIWYDQEPGNVSEVLAGVEVPVATVRRGLHEFLASGEQPGVVHTTDE